MIFQRSADFVDVGFRLVVLGLHGDDFIGAALKETEEALLVLIHIEALELGDHARKHFSHLAQILGAHIVEGGLRKVRNFFWAPEPYCRIMAELSNWILEAKSSTILFSSAVSVLSSNTGAGG